MKRSTLLGLATLAIASATLTVAPAAQADTSTQAQLEARVGAQIARLDAALSRVEHSTTVRRLGADVRAEVRANIAADQSDLADLAVEVSTADTLSDLQDLRDAVADYRVVVYTQAAAALHAADDLADKVADVASSIDLTAVIKALLGNVTASLDATVDGAVELDATSTQSEVRGVRADLHAAAHAYAATTR